MEKLHRNHNRMLHDSENISEHFKLYKAGKIWAAAGIISLTVGVAALMGPSTVHAADTGNSSTAEGTQAGSEIQASHVVLGQQPAAGAQVTVTLPQKGYYKNSPKMPTLKDYVDQGNVITTVSLTPELSLPVPLSWSDIKLPISDTGQLEGGFLKDLGPYHNSGLHIVYTLSDAGLKTVNTAIQKYNQDNGTNYAALTSITEAGSGDLTMENTPAVRGIFKAAFSIPYGTVPSGQSPKDYYWAQVKKAFVPSPADQIIEGQPNSGTVTVRILAVANKSTVSTQIGLTDPSQFYFSDKASFTPGRHNLAFTLTPAGLEYIHNYLKKDNPSFDPDTTDNFSNFGTLSLSDNTAIKLNDVTAPEGSTVTFAEFVNDKDSYVHGAAGQDMPASGMEIDPDVGISSTDPNSTVMLDDTGNGTIKLPAGSVGTYSVPFEYAKADGTFVTATPTLTVTPQAKTSVTATNKTVTLGMPVSVTDFDPIATKADDKTPITDGTFKITKLVKTSATTNSNGSATLNNGVISTTGDTAGDYDVTIDYTGTDEATATTTAHLTIAVGIVPEADPQSRKQIPDDNVPSTTLQGGYYDNTAKGSETESDPQVRTQVPADAPSTTPQGDYYDNTAKGSETESDPQVRTQVPADALSTTPQGGYYDNTAKGSETESDPQVRTQVPADAPSTTLQGGYYDNTAKGSETESDPQVRTQVPDGASVKSDDFYNHQDNPTQSEHPYTIQPVGPDGQPVGQPIQVTGKTGDPVTAQTVDGYTPTGDTGKVPAGNTVVKVPYTKTPVQPEHPYTIQPVGPDGNPVGQPIQVTGKTGDPITAQTVDGYTPTGDTGKVPAGNTVVKVPYTKTPAQPEHPYTIQPVGPDGQPVGQPVQATGKTGDPITAQTVDGYTPTGNTGKVPAGNTVVKVPYTKTPAQPEHPYTIQPVGPDGQPVGQPIQATGKTGDPVTAITVEGYTRVDDTSMVPSGNTVVKVPYTKNTQPANHPYMIQPVNANGDPIGDPIQSFGKTGNSITAPSVPGYTLNDEAGNIPVGNTVVKVSYVPTDFTATGLPATGVDDNTGNSGSNSDNTGNSTGLPATGVDNNTGNSGSNGDNTENSTGLPATGVDDNTGNSGSNSNNTDTSTGLPATGVDNTTGKSGSNGSNTGKSTGLPATGVDNDTGKSANQDSHAQNTALAQATAPQQSGQSNLANTKENSLPQTGDANSSVLSALGIALTSALALVGSIMPKRRREH